MQESMKTAIFNMNEYCKRSLENHRLYIDYIISMRNCYSQQNLQLLDGTAHLTLLGRLTKAGRWTRHCRNEHKILVGKSEGIGKRG
jgi:hypothetical protein